jgi:regulator of protease activity HflC (stomatin/prohibitin superfamily)
MKRILITTAAGVATVFIIIVAFVSFENIDANEIVIHQDFTSGNLTVWRKPGLNYKGFGRITSYPKSDEFRFLADKDPKGIVVSTKNCLQTRFNDKGKAAICGQVSFNLPTDDVMMREVHEKYGNVDSIRDRIVKATMVKAIYNAGPLMSSQESAGQRRGDLLTYMQDQATQGIYKTMEKEEVIEDLTLPPIEVVEMVDVPQLDKEGKVRLDEHDQPVMVKEARKKSTPQTKRIKVFIPIEKNGAFEVREVSVAKALNIVLHSFTIDTIEYEEKVHDQINAQRDMEMRIQTKIAEAESARQDAITSEQTGLAAAAKARWEQETIKAKEVTKAAQEKEVAALDLETARLQRDATVTRAEGEAKAKKLVMEADGALEKKLAAYVDINKAFAVEIGKQRWVPNVVMGGGPGSSGPGMDIMSMLAVKAAQDLALDPRPTGK